MCGRARCKRVGCWHRQAVWPASEGGCCCCCCCYAVKDALAAEASAGYFRCLRGQNKSLGRNKGAVPAAIDRAWLVERFLCFAHPHASFRFLHAFYLPCSRSPVPGAVALCLCLVANMMSPPVIAGGLWYCSSTHGPTWCGLMRPGEKLTNLLLLNSSDGNKSYFRGVVSCRRAVSFGGHGM